jgi:hypothetical protein
MVSTILILAVAASALIVSWKLIWRAAASKAQSPQELNLHQLNVQVFRALTNNEDEAYLRMHLGPIEMHSIQRKRAALALQMIRLVDENARMVILIAQRVKSVGKPDVAGTAEDLIVLALRLRINLFAVRFCLGMRWLLPGVRVFVPAWGPTYGKVTASLFQLREFNPPSPIHT